MWGAKGRSMNSIYYYPIRCLRWLLHSGGQWQYICPLLCVCAALYTFWLSSLAWCSFWLLHFMHDWNCIKILACKSSFFLCLLGLGMTAWCFTVALTSLELLVEKFPIPNLSFGWVHIQDSFKRKYLFLESAVKLWWFGSFWKTKT